MEKQNIEYKEVWKDEYLKLICGFANAQGGTIYIGKTNDGLVKGLNNSKQLLKDIPNIISDILGIVVNVNLLFDNGFEYIEIIIQSSAFPVSYKGQYHYINDNTKQALTGFALQQLFFKKLNIKWESTIIDNLNPEEMLNDSFMIFKTNAIKNGIMSKTHLNINNRELLDKLELIENGKLTAAGVLLFHHNPEKWIQGAYIIKISQINTLVKY